MNDQNDDSSKNKRGGQRLPQWAGYLLIAADVVPTPLFLLVWAGTLVGLLMALPSRSIWIGIGVVIGASIATLAAVTRAAAIQANQRGALGAYIGRLATTTNFGRWLTDFLSGSPR